MQRIMITMIALLSFCSSFAQDHPASTARVTEVEDGYLFDVSIYSEPMSKKALEEVRGARIEVFNNTTDKEVLLLSDHDKPTFQVHFEKGNHYTIMIRKKGYFNKRMEAYVDVKGCILCFDGIGQVAPNVSDAISEGHNQGALMADVKMERIEMNKIIQIDNIYYDLDKWDIRPDAARELDKVITVLNEHPNIIMELGSHTDARGRDAYNLELSEKRAQAAVNYIVQKGDISADRIAAKGYGETSLVNRCGNGVKCSDKAHQRNRRTELKITGMKDDHLVVYRPLSDIIRGERLDAQPGSTMEGFGTSSH
ncbi:MAG: OmpA family protein [Bacteroidota bacterium]